MCLDSSQTGWGELGDMHAHALRPTTLVAASYAKEVVSVWNVDLNKVNKDRARAKSVESASSSSGYVQWSWQQGEQAERADKKRDNNA